MLKSILLLIFLSFCIGTGVWLFFLHAAKRGDFDDIEGPKYRMLDDDEPQASTQQEEEHATDRDQTADD